MAENGENITEPPAYVWMTLTKGPKETHLHIPISQSHALRLFRIKPFSAFQRKKNIYYVIFTPCCADGDIAVEVPLENGIGTFFVLFFLSRPIIADVICRCKKQNLKQ